MMPNKFVHDQVYKACVKAGCDELLSKETAKATVKKYERGDFSGRVDKFIAQSVTNASKLIVKKKRAKK